MMAHTGVVTPILATTTTTTMMMVMRAQRFMDTDQLKFARRAYDLVGDSEAHFHVTKPIGWAD
jgi:hypothetical protein